MRYSRISCRCFLGALLFLLARCTLAEVSCPEDLSCGPFATRTAFVLRFLDRPPSLLVTDIKNAQLSSGSGLGLGSVGRGSGGTYKDLTLRLTNAGGRVLSIQSVTVSPNTQFSVIASPASALTGGASTTLQVRFVPSAAASDAAELTITTNDTHNQAFSLSLNGAGVDVGTGLSIYYPLDGNLNDMSGNVLNGIPVGTIAYVAGRTGQPGTAAALDGTGTNYFQATVAPGWAWNTTYSISVWVLTSQTNFALLHRTFTGLCTTQLEFGFATSMYQINRDSFTCGGWVGTNIAGGSQPGQWQHIAYVSNAGNVTVYLNGNLVGSGTISNVNAPAAGSNTMSFGFGVFMAHLLGSMDDVRVYNATAINPAQVQALYNQE